MEVPNPPFNFRTAVFPNSSCAKEDGLHIKTSLYNILRDVNSIQDWTECVHGNQIFSMVNKVKADTKSRMSDLDVPHRFGFEISKIWKLVDGLNLLLWYL